MSDPSEEFRLSQIYNEIVRRYKAGQREEALADINRLLNNSQELTEADISVFRVLQADWSKTLDPDYSPPPYPLNEDIIPLHHRAIDASEAGNYEESLRYAWRFVQYAAAGTVTFHMALSRLVDIAAQFDDMQFAAHAAEMYVGHACLLLSASSYPFTPVGATEPTIEHAWPNGPATMEFSIPFQAALKGIAEEKPATCWVRILEIAAYQMPNFQHKRERPIVVRALLEHYERISDNKSADRLRVDFADII